MMGPHEHIREESTAEHSKLLIYNEQNGFTCNIGTGV